MEKHMNEDYNTLVEITLPGKNGLEEKVELMQEFVGKTFRKLKAKVLVRLLRTKN